MSDAGDRTGSCESAFSHQGHVRHTILGHMTYPRDSTGLLFKDYPGPTHRHQKTAKSHHLPHSHSQASHQKQVSGIRFIRSLKLPSGTHYILQGGSMTSPERLLCNTVLSFIHDGMVIQRLKPRSLLLLMVSSLLRNYVHSSGPMLALVVG
jgi:hypothetical protein